MNDDDNDNDYIDDDDDNGDDGDDGDDDFDGTTIRGRGTCECRTVKASPSHFPARTSEAGSSPPAGCHCIFFVIFLRYWISRSQDAPVRTAVGVEAVPAAVAVVKKKETIPTRTMSMTMKRKKMVKI